MKIVEFLDLKKNNHIIRPYYLREFYKKLKYRELPENIFFKKIIIFLYTKILRKIKIYFLFFYRIKFKFYNPSKKNLVIIDDENFSTLKTVIESKDYLLIPSRINKIAYIHISKEIFFGIFKYLFKTSLKISYLCSLIEYIGPSSVITFIDNSHEFSEIVKNLNKKKIKFSAIQNSHRSSINYQKSIFNADNYYVFGNYEKETIKKNLNFNGTIFPVGSLSAAVAKKYLNENHNNIENNLYDICFISEPHYKFNSDWGHIHKEKNYNLQDSVKLLANYVLKFCEKNNKKLIFSGKADISSEFKEAEILSYQHLIKDYKFEISFHKKEKFENYKNLINSKLIIGMNSTILRECFEFKRKVLWCNLVDHIDSKSPASGICEFKGKSYSDFEERVKKILEINFDEYLKHIKNVDNFYNLKIDTLEYFKKNLI